MATKEIRLMSEDITNTLSIQSITELCFDCCNTVLCHLSTFNLGDQLKDELYRNMRITRSYLDRISEFGIDFSKRKSPVRLEKSTLLCHYYVPGDEELRFRIYEARPNTLGEMHPLLALSYLELFVTESMRSVENVFASRNDSVCLPRTCQIRFKFFNRQLRHAFEKKFPREDHERHELAFAIIELRQDPESIYITRNGA